MITYLENKNYDANKNLVELACLSTDTKPTDGIANGSACIEMDTGDKYMFDEAGGEWIKLGSGGGGDAEVWFTGENPTVSPPQTIFNLVNVGEINHAAELFNNGANYTVYLNGEELTVYDAENHSWANTDDITAEFMSVSMFEDGGAYTPIAMYMNTTAPTSVEVSVKAK